MADIPPGSDDKVKKMSVKEFREFGYLQELNRLYLHPMGLALEVIIHPDGTESFGDVWDGREDPEGFVYGPSTMEPEKAKRVYDELAKRTPVRFAALGFVVQREDQ